MGLRTSYIDNSFEKKILIGLIVDEKVCKRLIPILKEEYFKLPYSKRLLKWIKDYYSKYKKPPKSHIQDLYNVEKSKMRESEANLIEDFLYLLSSTYEEGGINSDYIIDKSLEYFKLRSLEILSNNIRAYITLGKVDEAEAELRNYKKVSKDTSRWIDPLDLEVAYEVFFDESSTLFKLPGALGDLLGPFERDQLVSIMAPMKRGKSFFLLEHCLQALAAGLRVVFVSLEMSEKKVSKRFYHRITGLGDREVAYYPCFDCKKNQDGSCKRPERASKVSLLMPDGSKPSIEEAPKDYRPCVWCRDNNNLKDFVPDTWYIQVNKPKITYNKLLNSVKAFKMMYNNRFKIISYPPYSASLSKIMADIESLEYTEDFVPDVIVIDYADIVAPEKFLEQERSNVNQVWKYMKRIARERHCLVLTATQTNRQALEKKNVSQVHTSEDIRKLAHVDCMIALNQTDREKKEGMYRVAIMVKREGEWDLLTQVVVLSNLATGQAYLDSEWYRKE